MTTTLERASRAIRAIDAGLTCDEAIDFARAVLMAVRDLPECVADEYFSRCSLGGDLTSREGDLPGHPINSVWPGMIEAILKEGAGTSEAQESDGTV